MYGKTATTIKTDYSASYWSWENVINISLDTNLRVKHSAECVCVCVFRLDVIALQRQTDISAEWLHTNRARGIVFA